MVRAPSTARVTPEPECNLNFAIKFRKSVLVWLMGFLVATSACMSFISFATFYAQHVSCDVSGKIGAEEIEIEERRTVMSAKQEFAKSNNNKNTALSTSEMATRFYEHHTKTIQSTINRTTQLFFGANDDIPFSIFQRGLGIKPNKITMHDKTYQLNASRLIVWRDICRLSLAFKKYRNSNPPPPPFHHIALLFMNENWGAFSRYVENRTTAHNNWAKLNSEEMWKERGCTRADIDAYLDGPDLKAAVTTQHQFFDHPKVTSLPIGFRAWRDMPMFLKTLGNFTSLDRPQLLMMNSNPHAWRVPLLEKVSENFYGTVKNTFGYDGLKGNDRFQAYLNEMRRSKFVLSPPGLGLDCYRHWEAFHMGTFPVIEHLNRTDGWYRSLADLPVAWIDSYENLTPEFLEKEYERLIAKPHSYKYEKLTQQYWIESIKSALDEDQATS